MQKDNNKSFLKILLDLINVFLESLKNLIGKLGLSTKTSSKVQEENNSKDKPPAPWKIVLAVVLGFMLLSMVLNGPAIRENEVPYNQFIEWVKENKVDKAVVSERHITGVLKSEEKDQPGKPFTTIPLWDQELASVLEEHDVEFIVRSGESWLGNLFFNWVIPLLILVAVWVWIFRKTAGGGARGFLNIGKKTKIKPESAVKVTFDDVAGAASAKQELKETIDFLKAPEKVQRLGGRMPKGVLLVGPPGTGKTLLAKAVSGEAKVPFFSISGSEFIELFVGVGASRVRDLFEQARQQAPCIIFIETIGSASFEKFFLGLLKRFPIYAKVFV